MYLYVIDENAARGSELHDRSALYTKRAIEISIK